MSKIIFAGCEIPSNRTLLRDAGAENVMLNYWGLRKRGLPKTKAYLIGEQFESHLKVWVDSGASQADKANLSKEELMDFAADYEEFIAMNYGRIEGFVEFDSQVLGLALVEQNRVVYENDPKLWVVWHESYGQGALTRWAEKFKNIAIPHEAIESVTSLAGITRGLKSRFDVNFHALATAKPDNLRQVPFTSATTLSWISPMRRGETIIWDGMKLVRYQKKMKAQARPRYKSIVQGAGLDFDKFINDDTLEATRVAIWSYLQLEANMDKGKPDLKVVKGGKKPEMLSDNSDDTLYTSLMEMDGYLSNNSVLDVRKVERTEVVQRDPQDMVQMPVVGFGSKTVIENEDGRDVLKQVATIQSNSVSLRQCNTCFIAANCPAFKEDNTCAFNLPIALETPDQLKAANIALVEMQLQRVMFMRYAEELNGGYADPNVSQEIDRYLKMLEKLKSLDENKEFVQITASRTSGGVLSAIFGDKVQAMKEYPNQISEEQTTRIIRDSIE